MKKEFKYDFSWHLIYSATIIIIIYLILCVPHIRIWVDKFNDITMKSISLDNLLTAQISVTFLTTSLLSILSIKDKIIYGVDVIQYKLEFPKHTNFVNLWSYLIALLSSSIIFFFIKENVLFIFSFLASLSVLIFLLQKILETFFNQENLKKEISRKITKEINRDGSTVYLSNLFESTLKTIMAGHVLEIKDNLILYINIIKGMEKGSTLNNIKFQFSILSNKLSEDYPSVFYSFKDIYINNEQSELYTRLSSNIVINSIINNNSIELRSFLMYDLIKMEIERIAPLFIDKLLDFLRTGFKSNQEIMSKINHLGEYDCAKTYMLQLRTYEFNKSINETENYFKRISKLYSSWISVACSTSNYIAIYEIYNQYKQSERGLYSLLDHNLKIIAGETGFYLRAIDFHALNYLKYVFLDGIKGHKIPDNILPDLINFVALIIAYEKKKDENGGVRLKNKKMLVEYFFESQKSFFEENGYYVEVSNCTSIL